MYNSPLVSYTKLSPHHSGKRTQPISRITPHCVVGQLSVETLGDIFYNPTRNASCQYGIGSDGRIAMYCEEQNRSWCSSSEHNDQRAVTIECASDLKPPFAFNNTVYNRLIELCVDICKRNNKTKLIWIKEKEKALSYKPAPNEMLLTVHRWFANKSCPGDWLVSHMDDLASKVTLQLTNEILSTNQNEDKQNYYRVQIGAFKNIDKAREILEKAKRSGFDPYLIQDASIYKVQIGKFRTKIEAETYSLKVKTLGFDTHVTTLSGKIVQLDKRKSVDEIAREVIKGLWGNGQERINKLMNAGYDPKIIAKKVNDLLKK